MTFSRVNKTTAHILNIPDIFKIREELSKRGKFSDSNTLYTVTESGFKLTVHTDWRLHDVVITIKSKPIFVSENAIFGVLKAEVDRMSEAA